VNFINYLTPTNHRSEFNKALRLVVLERQNIKSIDNALI